MMPRHVCEKEEKKVSVLPFCTLVAQHNPPLCREPVDPLRSLLCFCLQYLDVWDASWAELPTYQS